MATKLFDSTIVGTSEQALDFIGNILESSTEYSIIGKDLDGKILLWNEGARRLYGYEPEEVVGKAYSSIRTKRAKDTSRFSRWVSCATILWPFVMHLHTSQTCSTMPQFTRTIKAMC